MFILSTSKLISAWTLLLGEYVLRIYFKCVLFKILVVVFFYSGVSVYKVVCQSKSAKTFCLLKRLLVCMLWRDFTYFERKKMCTVLFDLLVVYTMINITFHNLSGTLCLILHCVFFFIVLGPFTFLCPILSSALSALISVTF